MKYLKVFNESIEHEFNTSDIIDIESFCYDHLPYLIDEGFGIRVRHGSNKTRARVELFKNSHIEPTPFDWDDIKDMYIQFYEILSEKYNISMMNTYDKIDDKWHQTTVKFDYRMPGKKLWETDTKWFSEKEILNNEVVGKYVGVVTIFLDK